MNDMKALHGYSYKLEVPEASANIMYVPGTCTDRIGPEYHRTLGN